MSLEQTCDSPEATNKLIADAVRSHISAEIVNVLFLNGEAYAETKECINRNLKFYFPSFYELSAVITDNGSKFEGEMSLVCCPSTEEQEEAEELDEEEEDFEGEQLTADLKAKFKGAIENGVITLTRIDIEERPGYALACRREQWKYV